MSFGILDYLAMAAYVLILVGIGLYFMRTQANAAEYFLGNRRFHWFPLAVGLFASLFSSVSFVAAPGEAYNNGLTLFLKSCFVLLGIPLAIIIFVRPFRRMNLTTAYEYLERRFDLRVRLLASGLFLLLRGWYLGAVLYATAVALRPATGITAWKSIILLGAAMTLYTTLGGLKSVVWADFLQFVVMFGGALVALGLLIAASPDGFSGIWRYAQSRGHALEALGTREFYSLSPFVRLSLWAMLLSSIFIKLGAAGTDQITVQRYLSTRDPKGAVKTMIWGTVLGVPLMLVLYLCGLGLLQFYHVHPERALPGMTGDDAFTHFISSEMPAGVGGLIMAGVLSAALGTGGSCLNSLSACTITDFWKRVLRPQAPEQGLVRLARLLTFGWGAISILLALSIIWLFGADRQKNSLIEITQVTHNFFTGVLLGVFLLGMLTRRASAAGALAGATCGLLAALAIIVPYYFVSRPAGAPRPSFLWINITGCLVTCFTGYAISRCRVRTTGGRADLQEVTPVEKSK
jgi:SSS family transporter